MNEGQRRQGRELANAHKKLMSLKGRPLQVMPGSTELLKQLLQGAEGAVWLRCLHPLWQRSCPTHVLSSQDTQGPTPSRIYVSRLTEVSAEGGTDSSGRVFIYTKTNVLYFSLGLDYLPFPITSACLPSPILSHPPHPQSPMMPECI